MKTILCVVDLGEGCVTVLDVAARIATACGAHLHVLYAYRLIDHDHRENMTALRKELESRAAEKFRELRKTIPALAAATCEFQAEIGFMSDRIHAYLNQQTPDMIVIGQDQLDDLNDGRHPNMPELIREIRIPFVLVPAEIRTPAGV